MHSNPCLFLLYGQANRSCFPNPQVLEFHLPPANLEIILEFVDCWKMITSAFPISMAAFKKLGCRIWDLSSPSIWYLQICVSSYKSHGNIVLIQRWRNDLYWSEWICLVLGDWLKVVDLQVKLIEEKHLMLQAFGISPCQSLSPWRAVNNQLQNICLAIWPHEAEPWSYSAEEQTYLLLLPHWKM